MDVRRAKALGEIAREDLALDLPVADPETGEITRTVPGRKTELVVHIDATDHTVARLGNTRTPVSVEQVKTWFGLANTTVIVRPVLDLAGHQHVDSYEIPDRIRRQIELRDHHCPYPHCARPAESGDIDHIEPYAAGGQTRSDNLAAPCRGHHRMKTAGKSHLPDARPRHLPVDHRHPPLPRRPHRHPRPLAAPPRTPPPAGLVACPRLAGAAPSGDDTPE